MSKLGIEIMGLSTFLLHIKQYYTLLKKINQMYSRETEILNELVNDFPIFVK